MIECLAITLVFENIRAASHVWEVKCLGIRVGQPTIRVAFQRSPICEWFCAIFCLVMVCKATLNNSEMIANIRFWAFKIINKCLKLAFLCINKKQEYKIWPLVHIKISHLSKIGLNNKTTNNSIKTLRHNFEYHWNKNQENSLDFSHHNSYQWIFFTKNIVAIRQQQVLVKLDCPKVRAYIFWSISHLARKKVLIFLKVITSLKLG
jgi:hypothetical protein